MMHPIIIALGFKTVEYLGRFCSWFVSLFTSSIALENEVLDFIAEDPYWHSARSVLTEQYLKTVPDGVGFSVTFLPGDLKDWERIKSHATSLRCEILNVWRKWRYLVPESKVENVMEGLWKRRLLEKLPSEPKSYRITLEVLNLTAADKLRHTRFVKCAMRRLQITRSV